MGNGRALDTAGTELGMPDGVAIGILVGTQGADDVGEDLRIRARFWGAKEAREVRADSASEAREENPVGMGMPPRFPGRNDTGPPGFTGVVLDGIPVDFGRLVLERVGEDIGTTGQVPGQEIGADAEADRELLLDLNGTPRVEPTSAKTIVERESLILNDRR